LVQKNVLTTGEVARICNVAPRTVSKWFDSGHLRGYRIPGGKDRRIPLNQLVRFMRAHGIPLNGLETGITRLLVLDADTEFVAGLKSTLATEEWELSWAESAIEAGALLPGFRPHALLADVRSAESSAKTIARFVRGNADLRSACLVATGKALTDSEGESLLHDGFDAYLPKPFDSATLFHLLRRLLARAADSAPPHSSSGGNGEFKPNGFDHD